MNDIFPVKHELGVAIAVGHVGHLVDAATGFMPPWLPYGFIVGIHMGTPLYVGTKKGFGIGDGEEKGPTRLEAPEALLEDEI